MLQVTNDNDVIAENEVTNSDGEVEETSNSRPESPELLIKHPLQVIFDKITWINIFTKISKKLIHVCCSFTKFFNIVPYKFQNSWTLWFFKPDKVDRNKKWEDCQRSIITFNTVEDFWALYNHIELASKLNAGCDYSLFKVS